MTKSLWNTYKIDDEGMPLHLDLATLHLWIQQKHDEVWVAHNYASEDTDFTQPFEEIDPAKIKWSRWALNPAKQEISVLPAFPNLPIIVSSEYPLKIAAHSKILIFTRIPVWVQVKAVTSNYILDEIPTTKLSRTWFGSPVEGELSYWLTTKARRRTTELDENTSVINCPIWIINKTDEELNFDKFSFHVDHLSIFKSGEALWADVAKIEYHGESLHSDIIMTGRMYEELKGGELISSPRVPLSKSFATRTFKKLFDDTFISAK